MTPEELEKRKVLAAKATKTYLHWKDIISHAEKCTAGCTLGNPSSMCDEVMQLLKRLPQSESHDMPHVTCVSCGKDWEEADYWETSNWEGEKLACHHCGMIHVVTATDYTLTVTMEETGQYDPFYFEGNDEEDAA